MTSVADVLTIHQLLGRIVYFHALFIEPALPAYHRACPEAGGACCVTCVVVSVGAAIATGWAQAEHRAYHGSPPAGTLVHCTSRTVAGRLGRSFAGQYGTGCTALDRLCAAPAQAQALLAAVRAPGPRGEHLEAFFGCLYYAAMRPSEVMSLREGDCHLPARGWGRIDLAASEPRAGRGWTDDGAAREARGLKHRAEHEMRSVPIPPELVALLRAHLQRYGTGPDGRLFRTSRDGGIQESAYGAIWQAARTAAFTGAQQSSPLARRAYDLRHAAVLSLWLNAGVPATEVARRAGHSVAVLLKVYAQLHRRPGRRRQPAHHRRPHTPR